MSILAICFSLIQLLTSLQTQGDEGLKIETAGLVLQSGAGSNGAIEIRCVVRNSADTVQEGMLVAKLTNSMTSDDRCRVQLDSGSTGLFEFPVRIPSNNLDTTLEIDVFLVNIKDGQEVLPANGEQPGKHRVLFRRPQAKKDIVTAFALGIEPTPPPDWRWEKAKVFDTMECALASRIDAGLTKNYIGFEAGPLPLNWLKWQGIDLLILADPNCLREQASISMLAAFLARGGRIWIMLDDIEVPLIQSLLEDHQSIRHVDTVRVKEIQVEVKNANLSIEDRTAKYDHSIPFKRVWQTGGEVIHSIDGWPASLIMPIGRGELIITTLDSEGWIEPRQLSRQDSNNHADYELRKWAKSILDNLYVQRASQLLKLRELSYPLQRIGNPVVSRAFVSTSLLLFCVVLLAIGLWRMSGKEVPAIGWWLPFISVVASVPIVVAGLLQKKDIPNTVAVFQWLQFHNPTGGSLRESAAVYLDAPSAMDLQSTRDGFAVPDAEIQSGITTMIHDAPEHWRMKNDVWPAGVWRYTTDSLVIGDSMVALGKWTPNGLDVQIPHGFAAPLEDPVMSFVAGAPSLGKKTDGGRILFDGEFPAEGDRWTLQSMVDEEQNRRVDVYRKYFSGTDRLQVQKRTLVGWSNLTASGPTWSNSLESRGAALVSFPVRLQKPDVGEEVFIPYPFISVRNTNLGSSTPIFMDGIGKWISQSSNPSNTVVEFILPEEVTPLEAKSIQISWDIEAPRRTAKLSFIDASQTTLTPLVELDAPSLPWNADIEDPLLLAMLRNGKLALKIEVSPDRESGGTLPWRIRHLRLGIRGTILAKHTLNAGGTDETKPINEPLP